ncbi:InlB B-repeat-containing protein [Peptococcus niger]|uniref:Listeria/Bacterioides repeat-containing protein n=1 Tax=Peptococcus niger TaxID=2741 RepID=A0A1G6UBX9_PEPNI|nr:InlB B-repeat-containing protein [Peptococcus niger]SDD38878.1 Listeria/Bacterioides repeat-containing protein [Peptococcus niger]
MNNNWKQKVKKSMTRALAGFLGVALLATSLPLPDPAFAQENPAVKVNHNDIAGDKAKFVNSLTPVQIARPKEDETAKDFVENPALPAIYTLRTDYKAEKGEKYSVNYQPYVASVGEAANQAEKAKVNKKIDLPNMAGYQMPEGETSFTNSYKGIVDAAKYGHKTTDNGDKFLALREYQYTAIQNNIQVKHTFQNMEDFNKFTNKDGTITKNDGTVIDKDGTETKYDLKDPDQKKKYQEFVRDHENIRILSGNTGSTLEVQPLQEDERPGFEPQVEKLKTQVPEDTSKFKIEYRYNRAAYDVVFDTQDGTPLPTRTYYYDQEIPKIDENSIPTKIGCEFQGWIPSRDLEGVDGKIYKKGEIIKDANDHAVVDLGNIYYKRDGQNKLVVENGDPVKGKNATDIQLKVPAMKLGDGKSIPREKLTFTAVWKDKEKADYAIQFWAEKADHPENASLLNKYDYMGTRVYEQEPTGKRPELKDEKPGPVKIQVNGVTKTLPGLNFPDLDETRLQKIWNGEKFNRGHDLYLNKFFVYNKKLTDEQNKDPNAPTMTKAVSATGKTVYNIYYDRQVYDLYFTKSNVQPGKNTIYPEIWGYDPAKGESVMLGGPGNLYHYKARFNEMMYKWPNDAKQTKGFTPGYQSFGWGPNYVTPNWPLHLDTPPYRLNADEFLDMENYTKWGGYVKHIDKGDGTTIDLEWSDFTTLSFGIKQDHPSIPHHMDFWMDGFKKGETIIRYDLVRTKADTAGPDYGHRYPIVTGFTPYGYDPKKQWPTIEEGSEENGRVDEDGINELNDDRDEITPNHSGTYYNNQGIKLPIGQLDFIPVFFSDSDEFGDVKDGGQEFKENGYLQFKYTRNKYPLRFNTDPTKIKGDSEFNKTNQLETFYEFPLKALSPDVDEKNEYQKVGTKEGPKNLLDDPDNLFKLGLTDLLQKDKNDPNKFFQDAKGHYRVKRPEGLSDQMVFKGWAMDPAGKKMVWKNKDETMPFHPMNLYAIWDEPDYKWKVTVDPNGGTLPAIDPDSLTTEKKTIKEGDIGREEENTYPVAGYEGKDLPTEDKNKPQVFTVVQKQKLKKLPKPERYGYDFLGWEVVRYQRTPGGDYTNEQDNSYRDKYKVPELYSFGTDVVSPIYLKAIWVENKRAKVEVLHYFLKNEKTENGEKLVLDTSKYPNPVPNNLAYKRVGDYVPATGERQDEHWILANNAELMEKLDGKWVEQIKDSKGKVTGTKEHDLKPEYEKYNERVKLNNTFFQSFRVQDNINEGTDQNPVYKPNPENIFRFYYRPFRTRDYKVNYIDERGKAEVEAFFKGLDLTDTKGLTDDALLEANTANKAKFEANRGKLEDILNKYKVINKEDVTSQCRHYDARNYRPIPGWTLVGKPQQQLFYDVNENTNEFLGINGTGSDEIYFYYKDARVIEVPGDKEPPKGYVRVTFKIDDKHKGGVFKDKDGKEVTELHYDVIKGLKSNNLPHPIIWKDGKDDQGNDKVKEANRYYITPDQGKTFKDWDNEKWLNDQTDINRDYTFTAYFDWSGLTAKGMVRTESYTDPKGKWTNAFAPTIEDLKKQLVWKEKDEVKPIPDGTTIEFFDEAGNELKTNEDIFNLVNEKKAADKDEVVRTVNIKVKVTFKDGKDPQELTIPITVYKNVYEALNKEGDKPIYLSDAEKLPAEKGGLKDYLSDTESKAYVKVTVSPTKDLKSKDTKVYYANPKAWVEIPEIDTKDNSRFTNWTADKDVQNEDGKKDGVFDFTKRHMFTEDTIITPGFAGDVVEQEKGKDKPNVPESYVKVIVRTTDKAKDESKFERTFWVNPATDVAIDVPKPEGKTDQEVDLPKIGKKKVNYVFNQWQKVKAGEADDKLTEVKPAVEIDLAKNKYTDKVTVIEASYFERFAATPIVKPIKTEKLDTPEGKEITDKDLIDKITPPENKEIESITVVERPDPSKPGKQEAKVTIKYKDGSTQGSNENPVVIPVEVHKNIIPEAPGGQKPKDALENYVKVIFTAGEGGTVSGDLVYYVSPEVEVDMTESADKITKTPGVGYTANGGTWSPEIKAEKIENEKTYTFNFVKSKDIVEKTDDSVEKPEGYVTVKFIAGENGEVVGGDKTYYVNPAANIKLVDKDKATQGATNELIVPDAKASDNYGFTGWVEEIDYTNPIKGDREHVAHFAIGQVTLTYDKGGEDVTGDVPKATTVNHGTTVRLAGPDQLKKANAVFAGWKIGDNTYQAGDEVTLNENTTAIAQWNVGTHTVIFDLNKGTIDNKTVKDPVQVEHGKTLGNITDPEREGYVFTGWKAGTEPFDPANTPVNSDVTLVAQWEKAVEKIGENDPVDQDHFIKVTFLKGNHGNLKDEQAENLEKVTYKVAKDYTFDDAVKHSLVVPGIAPAKYYKAKDANGGWDKALELNKQNIEFTAQYEPEANVIPVDPKVTPDNKLQEDKPDGMVLVVFEVDSTKAYMLGDSKFYVKKSEVVNIKPPLVVKTDESYNFNGWDINLDQGQVKAKFEDDSTITSKKSGAPDIQVQAPSAGAGFVEIANLTDGATGHLVLTRGGQEYKFKSVQMKVKTRVRRKVVEKEITCFDLSTQGIKLQSKDMISVFATNGDLKSDVREYTVR